MSPRRFTLIPIAGYPRYFSGITGGIAVALASGMSSSPVSPRLYYAWCSLISSSGKAPIPSAWCALAMLDMSGAG